MEKLQTHFLEGIQEKLEFGKQLKLEHRYVLLSRSTDTMAESGALCEKERAVPNAQQGDLQEVSLRDGGAPTRQGCGSLPPREPH
jgi:hypothetical protein